MKYHIYKLSYEAARSKPRVYVGHTGSREWRRAWHETTPNAWNKHGSASSPLKWVALETCGSKPLALALEAFHASRAIAAEPDAARGGRWAKPTLLKAMRDEALLVSRMSLAVMMTCARDNPGWPLGLLLADLPFTRTRAATGAATARSVTVLRERSGYTGSAKGSERYERLHRGRDTDKNERKGTSKHISCNMR